MDILNILVVLLLSLSLCVCAVVLTWLYGRYKALEAAHFSLVQSMDQLNSELAGLCATHLRVDASLISQEKQIQAFLVQPPQAATPSREQLVHTSYEHAIERVRMGAKPSELVAEFGMSASEAELLVRLHTGKS